MASAAGIFDEVPLQKLRPSAVYLNARRYGMNRERALDCADTWKNVFNTCFTQRVAGQFYKVSSVNLVDFPAEQPTGCLFVTAHFSAYTFVSIALARHYKKNLHIVVGTPPKEFEDYLVDSLAEASVVATIIRSDFSQLRKIRRAVDAGELVVSLIDVPWHRTVIKDRRYEYFKLGAGEIQASRSIFKIADRLDLSPTLVLCVPNGDAFDIVFHGHSSQQACFDILADLIECHPGHFERFCEMHMYYRGGHPCDDLTTFLIGAHRYVAVATRQRYWKLGAAATRHIEEQLGLDDNRDAASATIKHLVRQLTGADYDDVIYF